MLNVLTVNGAPLKERAALKDRLGASQVDHGAHKVGESLLCFCEIPVHPGHVVVLAIGIIVSLLAMAEIITGQEHGHTLRQQQGGDEVALLLPAQRRDGGIVGRALSTAFQLLLSLVPSWFCSPLASLCLSL